MRAGPFAVICILLIASAAFAAEPMAPRDIQATFFNGQSFTASTLDGTKFKMTFTPDGKMIREPLAHTGYKNAGTWKLDAKGFCTTWQHAKPTCLPSFQTARIDGRFKNAQPQLQPQLQCGPNSDVIVGSLQSPLNQSPVAPQPSRGTPPYLPKSVTQNSASSTPTTTPPTVTINGDNPASIIVGDSYADLGVTVTDTGPGQAGDTNLGYETFLNGTLVSNILLDTSQVATDTIN
jgi:hypothetical protein